MNKLDCKIAKNFRYYTGLAGSGKTFFMIRDLLLECAKGRKVLYFSFESGYIDGLVRYLSAIFSEEERDMIKSNIIIKNVNPQSHRFGLADLNYVVQNITKGKRFIPDIVAIDNLTWIKYTNERDASIYNSQFIRNEFMPIIKRNPYEVWFTEPSVAWGPYPPIDYLAYHIQETRTYNE